MAMVRRSVSVREGGEGGSVLHAAIHAVEGSVLITYTVHIRTLAISSNWDNQDSNWDPLI